MSKIIRPNSDVTKQWTPNISGSHYPLVNESVPDEDTSYIYLPSGGTYTYSCDGLPDTATPPMTVNTQVYCAVTSSNGLLHFASYQSYFYDLARYQVKWTLPSTFNVLEFEVSFPNWTCQPSLWLQAMISIPNIEGWVNSPIPQLSDGINFAAVQDRSNNTSYLMVKQQNVLYNGIFQTTWNGKIVKNQAGNWDVYLNGSLIASNLTLPQNTNGILFQMKTPAYRGQYLDMDYFNVWVDSTLIDEFGFEDL